MSTYHTIGKLAILVYNLNKLSIFALQVVRNINSGSKLHSLAVQLYKIYL